MDNGTYTSNHDWISFSDYDTLSPLIQIKVALYYIRWRLTKYPRQKSTGAFIGIINQYLSERDSSMAYNPNAI